MTASLPSRDLVTILDNKLQDLANFILENEAVLPIRIRQERYTKLLSRHKSALKSVVKKQQANKASGQKPCQQKLLDIENVEPPKELQDIITSWTDSFDSFFQDPVAVIPTTYCDFTASFVRVGRNEAKRGVATIQRRFDLESIYMRVSKSNYHNGKQWLRGGSDRLAQRLKQSTAISADVEEVRKQIENYVELGSSFHLWAEKLGGSGYFIVLPQTVAEGFYERRQTRAHIPKLVDKLVALGIRDTAAKWKVLPLGSYISQRLQEESQPRLASPGTSSRQSATQRLPGDLQTFRLESPCRRQDSPEDTSMASSQSVARPVLQPNMDSSFMAAHAQNVHIDPIQGAIQFSGASPGDVSLQSGSMDSLANAAQPASQNINAGMEGLLTAAGILANQSLPERERTAGHHNFLDIVNGRPESNTNFNKDSNNYSAHSFEPVVNNYALHNFEPEYSHLALNFEPEYDYLALDFESESNSWPGEPNNFDQEYSGTGAVFNASTF